jgi:hypothetical protein
MTALSEMAEAIRLEAGWSRAPEDQNGSVEFRLADGVSFSLISRGAHLAAFRADLGPWPEGENEAGLLARRLSSLSAATFFKRRSIVSSAGGRYGLHLAFDPVRTGLEEIPGLCARFLNDLDWWRLNAGGAY